MSPTTLNLWYLIYDGLVNSINCKSFRNVFKAPLNSIAILPYASQSYWASLSNSISTKCISGHLIISWKRMNDHQHHKRETEQITPTHGDLTLITGQAETRVSGTYFIYEGVDGDVFKNFLVSKTNSSLHGKHIFGKVWTNHPWYIDSTKVASSSDYTVNSWEMHTET